MTFGWRVYGMGVIALGALCIIWGDFVLGQPVRDDFPARTALAYAAGMFMLAAGACVEWRRTVTWGAAALTVYYVLVVVVLMNGRVALAHYSEFSSYYGIAEQFAIAAAGLIVFAAGARIDANARARFTRLGQAAFAICALLFGAAHFVYLDQTAPLVPGWLPPGQEFWAYATGLCHVAAGIAILTGVRAHLAAILLTVMYASFTPLVHLPMLLADHSRMNWTENAINLVLTGAAWVVADSLARDSRRGRI
jgi:uncharacterized membrane protein